MKRKIRTIMINGVKTDIILPRGMKPEEMPKVINTHPKCSKGLIFQV
ncbi:hypothetical protein J4442_00470 [Candidatus Woesearchaeota archaeon]|nr:hypothetical protein [Candidatus Woesearchaeota archaeon]